MNHYTFNGKYCIMLVIGLAPDGQSTNFQRNPVTSMMPYITGTLIETVISSSLVIEFSFHSDTYPKVIAFRTK